MQLPLSLSDEYVKVHSTVDIDIVYCTIYVVHYTLWTVYYIMFSIILYTIYSLCTIGLYDIVRYKRSIYSDICSVHL